VDAIVLAAAGLTRLGLMDFKAIRIPTTLMLPSAGQGIIALQCRLSDAGILGVLQELSDPNTTLCATAERAMLHHLGGSCRTPIAAHATLEANHLIVLHGMLACEDSQTPVFASTSGHDPNVVGKNLAEILRQKAQRS
jgi:hydroxymethylbilane synthase